MSLAFTICFSIFTLFLHLVLLADIAQCQDCVFRLRQSKITAWSLENGTCLKGAM